MKGKLKFIVLYLFITVFTIINQACESNKNKKNAIADITVQNNEKDPLTLLKEGNERFYNEKSKYLHQDSARIKELVKGQSPIAVVVSCSDSRVPPEIVFDQGLGDIFTIRTAGNVMADYEEGSVEYAVEHLNTALLVVLGHENCGAIGAFLEHEHDDDVPGHIASIVKAIKEEQEEQEVLKSGSNVLERAVKANVVHGVKHLRNLDPILSEMYKKGKINIIGAVYHLETGKVEFLEENKNMEINL